MRGPGVLPGLRVCIVGVVMLTISGILVVGASARTTSSAQSSATQPDQSAFAAASWPATGGDLANSRYSTLTQITPANVKNLTRVWTTLTDSGFKTGPVESPPTVIGSTMYASSSRGALAALDTATGALRWVTDPTATSSGPSRGVAASANGRGQAYGDGMIFQGQGDGTIDAIDATTGATVWKTLINTAGVPTYAPATPVYYNHMVYTSLSGNEFGQLRGAIYAYDARDGALVWTWYVVPFAGQPGSKTWANKAELAGGGGGNWTYGAIDPKHGLLYESTGNPAPDFGRGKGSDLYTDSMVALTLKTGKMKWFFQTTHHDEWDYDCASPPILWDHVLKGKMVHGIEVACKSGYVYELDRLTGKPATPVVETPPPNAKTVGAATLKEDRSWAKTQPIPTGSSVVPHCAHPANVPGPAPDGKPYEYTCTFGYVGTDHYTVLTPGINGDINYEPSGYSPKLGYVYVCSALNFQPTKVIPGAPSPLGAIAPTFANLVFGPGAPVAAPGTTPHLLQGTLTALNLNNNKTVWQRRYYSDDGGACMSGASVTASGIVFLAHGGTLWGYDAAKGKVLWSYTPPEGVVINSAPAIYTANGKEYVAWNADLGAKAGAATGQDAVIAFGLPG
jgi:PQQ-dependent dehydrogenase (methanol/ethanol family)